MSRAAEIAAERWELADAIDGAVVVAGTTTCVAVLGDPMEDPTPEDLRRGDLVAAAPAMFRLLREVREQFASYAQQHRAKGTEDADRKAATNQDWVRRCDEAIAAAWPTVVPLS